MTPSQYQTLMKSYYAKEFARNRWHIIAPDGFPLYDDAPYGNDKPIVIKDEDAAIECVERLNMEREDEAA